MSEQDEFEIEDAKNKRTLAEFEADMCKMDLQIGRDCGAVLTDASRAGMPVKGATP